MIGIFKTPEPPKGEHWWDGVQHQLPGNWLGAVTSRANKIAPAQTPQLGRARKRIWEVAWTDPIPWRFADAYMIAEPQAR